MVPVPSNQAEVATNGATSARAPRPAPPGVYVPLPAFFLEGSQDLDIPTYQKHAVKMAQAGIGLVVSGTMGEAHHLSPEERVRLIKAARSALDSASPSVANVPIIAGTGGNSTRQTIELTKQAYEAGADYAIVIPPGFFGGALAGDRAALKEFYSDVAKSSPLPIFIYNYPGVTGGIDLDSDIIEELAADNSNIVGVKLTCGNVGKLTRIALATSDLAWVQRYPRSIDSPFLVLGGFVDFFLPSLFAKAHGAITGLANVAPHTMKHFQTLAFSVAFEPESKGSLAEAQRLQDIVAKADRTLALAGIGGTKWLLRKIHGNNFYPSGSELPRKPLKGLGEDAGEQLLQHENVVRLLQEEKRLAKEIGQGTNVHFG